MLLTSASRGRVQALAAASIFVILVLLFRSNIIETASWPSSIEVDAPAQTPAKPSPEKPQPHVQPQEQEQQSKQAAQASKSAPSVQSTPSLPQATESSVPQPQTADKGPCDGFPDTSDILLVMKTGATEAYDKLPIHFMTTLRCVQDYILFSDMEMNMAEHHLVDALDEISDEVKRDNDDFKLYSTLKEYERLGMDPRSLKDGGNGWNLDKYKFVPMMTKTWKYRQDAKWYVFIEADTGLNWQNLRVFLDKLDAKKAYYIGSPTFLDIEFAHGGTGYIISGAAMKKAVGGHPDLQAKYDGTVAGICCGDRMTARILLDEEIKLTKAWPMLNGEKLFTIPYGESHWCQPVITMHHMTAREVSQVWNFEQERKAQGNLDPILWKDIYDKFVHDNMHPRREDWSNLSNDITYTPDTDRDFHGLSWSELTELERASAESAENCQKLCESDKDCFQWEHHGQECKLGRSFKFGEHKAPQDKTRYISGWKFSKIGDFRASMANCSKGPDWTWHEPEVSLF